MKCQEALIEFSHLLLVGSMALENVIDDATMDAAELKERLVEVRSIAARLRDMEHEFEHIGGGGQSP